MIVGHNLHDDNFYLLTIKEKFFLLFFNCESKEYDYKRGSKRLYMEHNRNNFKLQYDTDKFNWDDAEFLIKYYMHHKNIWYEDYLIRKII